MRRLSPSTTQLADATQPATNKQTNKQTNPPAAPVTEKVGTARRAAELFSSSHKGTANGNKAFRAVVRVLLMGIRPFGQLKGAGDGTKTDNRNERVR